MKKLSHQLFYVGIVILFCISLYFSPILFQDQNLRVIFLDVGQGDATLIMTPRGRSILIDAGKYPGLGSSLSSHMKNSDRSIDLLIATHPDLDHIGGMSSIIDEYDVDIFMHSGYEEDSLVYRNLIQDIVDSDTKMIQARAGQRIVLEEDLYLDILSPYKDISFDEKNEHSVVMKLSFSGKSFLLMADASVHNEQELVRVYGEGILKSDVLKIGHHGSRTSSSPRFLDLVHAEYAVVSAACQNSFGHPHWSVMQDLLKRNMLVLETCREGDIVFEIDENLILKN